MTMPLQTITSDTGVFLRREALALGYDDRAIARLVRSGEWVRVRRGAYAPATLWQGLDAGERFGLRGRAVMKSAQTDVVLSHTSALQEAGHTYWDLDRRDVHLTRTDRRAGRREAGVRQHRGLLLPEDITTYAGVPCTTPTRTALDITTIADTEHALVVVDALLHAELTDQPQLASRYELMKHTPDTLSTDIVLRLADGRRESVLESRTFFQCWRAGLPKPEPQYPIYSRSGRLLALLDLALPEHRVFIECDGRSKYLQLRKPEESIDHVILREKERQDRVVEATGWACVRVVWDDLRHPSRLVHRIERAIARQAAA